jgi:hypothetical protein
MDHPSKVKMTDAARDRFDRRLHRRLLLVAFGTMPVLMVITSAVVNLTQENTIVAVGMLALDMVVLLTVVLWVAARGLACVQTTDGYVFWGLARRTGERFTTRQTIENAWFHATTQGLQFQTREGRVLQTSAQAGDWPANWSWASRAPWTDIDVVALRWCTLRVTVRSTQESLSFYTPVAHRVAHIVAGLQDGRC